MPFDIDARIAEWRKRLLDTTKRNRLIKFVAGRIGGIQFVYPKIGDLWSGLVQESCPFTFPWKSDLLGLSQSEGESDRHRDDTPLQSDTAIVHPEDFAGELTERARQSPNLRPNHILTDFADNTLVSRQRGWLEPPRSPRPITALLHSSLRSGSFAGMKTMTQPKSCARHYFSCLSSRPRDDPI